MLFGLLLKSTVRGAGGSVDRTLTKEKSGVPGQTAKRQGKRRRRHSDRAKPLVRFEDLSPARCYVADAATRPSESARLRAEELRADEALRYAQFGRLDAATGLRYAPARCEYAGDVKVSLSLS
eukprot:COSAG03_NODE_11036_length_615_cov_0.953488_1_plen_122_part_10